LIAVLAGGAACGGPAPDSAPAAPPPVPVQLATVEARPVDRSSDFIATVQSLSSSTVQPEVEGVVTRVFVRSGDRVARGTPLVQISADRQAAAVRSAEANREGTEADVRYWQQQVERFKSLLEAGAISRQEFDQAQTSLDTARARLGALDAQVREGNVQLQYYRVVARQAGMVGDIPVRVGDRVTTGTVITTIDASEDLEAHIQVPLDRSPDLQTGLQVQLLTPAARSSPPIRSASSPRGWTTRPRRSWSRAACATCPPRPGCGSSCGRGSSGRPRAR
jgi:RND family efflux transporter MFP subunit